MVYPGAVPEFRILKTITRGSVLQVRYLCPAQGYVGKWQDVPIVEELIHENTN